MLQRQVSGVTKSRSRKSQYKNSFILRFRPIRWSILTILLLATGCTNRESLLKEIGEFDQAVQTGTEAIAAYYTNLNEQEMKLYSMVIELEPNCELGDRINYNCLDPNWDRSSGAWFDSPLKQPPFPLESIQVRLDLLKELTEYSKTLAAIAGDESGEKFQGNITTLTQRLGSLEKKLQTLEQGADSGTPDSTITQRYLTPIGTIIGILVKIQLEEAKWNTIRESVIEAEESVNTVLDEVANDLDTYVYPLTITGADQRYSLLIQTYNEKRLQLSQGARRTVLDDIITAKTTYDLALVNLPSKIPNNLKGAHTSLVKIANSDGAPKDLAELRAWLERFKDDAQQLKTAIEQLAGLNNNGDN